MALPTALQLTRPLASQPKLPTHDPQDRHYKKVGDDCSAEDMAMFKEAFELFDTDGTGAIDCRELKFCCKVRQCRSQNPPHSRP